MLHARLTAVAALACAATASADIVGGVFLTNDAWNSAASGVLGQTVTVTRFYAAFDDADNIALSVDSGIGELRTNQTLYQSPTGGDVSQPVDPGNGDPLQPANEWDSHVGIGAVNPPHMSMVAPDFAFQSNGVDGTWFGVPEGGDPTIYPGWAGGSNGVYDEDSGLYLVFLGQFTLLGDHDEYTEVPELTAEDPFIATQLFTGDVEHVAWLGSEEERDLEFYTPMTARSADVPAPAAAALLALAGAASTRRRR